MCCRSHHYIAIITNTSSMSFSRSQHLPANGHGPRQRHVLRVHSVGVRRGRVPVDAVLLRADLHVAELRDPTRGQGRGVRGPQDIGADRHKLRVHRSSDLLRLHRTARLPAHRRH